MKSYRKKLGKNFVTAGWGRSMAPTPVQTDIEALSRKWISQDILQGKLLEGVLEFDSIQRREEGRAFDDGMRNHSIPKHPQTL